MKQKQRLVVIGNGMAGARLVEEVLARQGGDLFEIVVFGNEPYGNYNRILLSNVLAGTHDPKDIFINPLTWYEENQVTLHVGRPVSAIDPRGKVVHTADGLTEPYDRLVIATGSSAYVPQLENLVGEQGQMKEGVFVFRTLDDCERMISFSQTAQRAAVIGGGLLGLEAARGLLNRKLDVDVIHVTAYPMNVQLDPPSGKILQQALAAMGVRLHLDKRTTAVQGNGHITGLTFQDGSELACDMLVISTGIRPNVELARRAGLLVEQGIVVRDDLSCPGAPGIYALGECAQHRSQTYGLVAPLWDQAQILAERLTNDASNTLYEGSRISTKLKVMGIDLAVMGEKDARSDQDEVVTYTEPARGVYKKLIIRDGQLAGAIVMGDGQSIPRLLQAFERGSALPANRAELLFPLANEARAINVADLPDTAQICNCNGVSKGKLL
ncbi:MAG TPA: FAD-dependent oxidoreductase, partial [Ktedonobacteraceae bacterium]|nr:FAD-dependent oxidoreductase [Ktedonobacteraceae bacterium]